MLNKLRNVVKYIRDRLVIKSSKYNLRQPPTFFLLCYTSTFENSPFIPTGIFPHTINSHARQKIALIIHFYKKNSYNNIKKYWYNTDEIVIL